MEKQISFLSLFLISLTIFSCSNDETSKSIIIGKWRIIEKYESGIQVDLTTCEPHFYTEYKADKWIISYRIISDTYPQECGLVSTELGWNWSNLGNNKYRIRHLEEQGQIFTIYKDGENLVIENPDGITKRIFEPY